MNVNRSSKGESRRKPRLPLSCATQSFRGNLRVRLSGFIRAESGATAIESGLIIARMAVALIGGLTLLGPSVKDSYERTAQRIVDAG